MHIISFSAASLVVVSLLLSACSRDASTSVGTTSSSPIILQEEQGEMFSSAAVARDPEDMLHIDNPASRDVIGREVTIRGQARGGWYFEADFPVEVLDADGRRIAEGYAVAQDDWMTDAFVPFEGTITIPEYVHSGAELTLRFRRANASGLPENDMEIAVPVVLE